MKKKKQQGFIALITTIIISAVLLAVVCAIGGTSVLHRLNIASAENLNQSKYLADACAYKALVNLAYDKNYQGNENINVSGNDTCVIEPIPPPTQNQISLQTRAQVAKSITHLSMVVDNASLSVISWREIP
jgi:hypothetical protein